MPPAGRRRAAWLGAALLAAAACATGTAPPSPTAAPAPLAAATPTPAPATIRGRIWHDVCAVAGGEGGAPAVPSAGCVPDLESGYRANGVLEPGEPGLAGVQVALGAGPCPATGVARAATAADGTYAFAGLRPATYCVSVEVSGGVNAQLLPGQWTYPPGARRAAVAAVAIALAAGEERSGVDFGWDYQFLP